MMTLVLSVAIFVLAIVFVYLMNGEVVRPEDNQFQINNIDTEETYDE